MIFEHQAIAIEQAGQTKAAGYPGEIQTVGKACRVQCRTHGLQTAYIVCGGVMLHGKPVAEFIPATPDSVGQILCADGKHDSTSDAFFICEQCAKSKGWFPKSQ